MKIYEIEVNNLGYGRHFKRYAKPVKIQAKTAQEAVVEFKKRFPKWIHTYWTDKQPFRHGGSCATIDVVEITN
jgi:hypothetical protein